MENTQSMLDDIQESNDRILKSGVRDVFTPHIPIKKADCLKGRIKELKHLIQHLTTPGEHALLFGERGVGKSSLAQTASIELSNRYGFKLYNKQCSKSDNFSSIFEKPLLDAGIDINEIATSKSKQGGISINPLAYNQTSETQKQGENILSLNPSFVSGKIKDIKGLLLIDEFDAISSAEDKSKIAEVIKLLSDTNSNFKVLIVGIADSAKDLTLGHPSLTRCLREIRVRRMLIADLSQIIRNGASRLKIEFEPLVIAKISIVSTGYPYFTHLLALKSSELVIADERKKVELSDLLASIEYAVEDSEGSLTSTFADATNTQSKEMVERLLLACAACNEFRFTGQDICKKFYDIYKNKITTKDIAGHLSRLVSPDGNKIIRRLSKGIYRFSDPRMPSFIKMHKAYLPEEES